MSNQKSNDTKQLFDVVPECYNAILGILEDCGVIEIEPVIVDKEHEFVEERIRAKVPFNPDVFSDTELRVLREIACKLGDKTSGELLDLVNSEPSLSEIEAGEDIPYEKAKDLKIEI